MRFYTAVVMFAVSALALIIGFGQQTIWRPPSEIIETPAISEQGSADAPLTVIDGTVLDQHDGKATVRVSGTDRAFAAVGPSDDVDAWVADAQVNRVSTEGRDLTVSASGDEATVPDPAGSDLWTSEQSGSGTLTMEVDSSSSTSVIIASDGTHPAPADVTVTWPNINPTPWVRPLQVVGYLLLLGGFVLLLIDRFADRRGPRRRSHRRRRLGRGGAEAVDVRESVAGAEDAEAPRPADTTDGDADAPGQGGSGTDDAAGSAPANPDRSRPEASPRSSRSTRSMRRPGRLAALLAVAISSALAVTGCASGASDTESESATAPSDDTVSTTPVLKAHFQTILDEVAQVADQADASLDGDLLATRFAGEALSARQGAYTIKAKYGEATLPDRVVSSPMSVFLPPTSADFPRTVMVAVEDDQAEGQPKRLMVLRQDSPRENYKVVSIISHLFAGVPDLPSELVGTTMLGDDQLSIPASQAGTRYSDILLNGDSSQFATEFTADEFLTTRREKVTQQRDKLGEDGKLDVSYPAGATEPIALATADGDGLVFVSLDETWDVRPAKENGVIKDLPALDAAMIGASETKKGLERTYSTMLVFSVPKDAGGQAQLVGYSWQQASVKELE